MPIQRLPSGASGSLPNTTETSSPKGYRILSNDRTVSKSAQSKIKNLAHFLSTPFRAVMRQFVQGKTGDSTVARGLINIKSAPAPAPASTEVISQSGVAYEVLDVNEGFRRQSLFGKIFG